jgi:acyl CoA:acetate/3-ketoacid CoA transferase alpha subunit/acyl CoA:acetate/3-ketoacid CoA transferase beta subunit
MKKSVEVLLRNTFKLRRNEGSDKVTSLEKAIKSNIKPGMKLHIREGAGAATREVLRQFRKEAPGFTLITCLLPSYGIGMIHSGLVRKVITTLCAEGHPAMKPVRVVQRAYAEGKIEIENWSLYSFVQRLMAGAFGVCFMPTKSITASSMAEENEDSFQVIQDPFGSGKKLGLVKALNPDLSLVHGWVADRYGNTITGPARGSGEGAWGPKASLNGVMVTVERLVSTDFIRRHAYLVDIPGYLVNSVSVCPLGAHPSCLVNPGLKGVEVYGEDYEFQDEEQKAGENRSKFEDWIRQWVLDCPSHDGYLHKLGRRRIASLKERAIQYSWKGELNVVSGSSFMDGEAKPRELMILAAAQKIIDKSLQYGYETILAGAGTAGLAAWTAYYQLKGQGQDAHLLLGSGFWGYAPRPDDPSVLNTPTMATCKMMTDVLDSYGVFVGSDNRKCLAVIGGGEIDKNGNINSTKIPGRLYLTGSGGGNDAVNASEVIVVMNQSKDRFIEKVPYITCPGHRVKTLVSDFGVFEKLGEDNELTLTGYLSTPLMNTAEKCIKAIKEKCGWSLKVSPSIKVIPKPAHEELVVLRALDPKGYFRV